MGYPMNAKDSVYSIVKINSAYPLKTKLMNAIAAYGKDQ